MNVTYSIVCQECKIEGRLRQYIGETHRTYWDRAKEHTKALKDKDTSYGIMKHWVEEHPELTEPPNYKFQVTQTQQTSLNRQIWEALNIEGADPATLLNTKTEWGKNPLQGTLYSSWTGSRNTSCSPRRPPNWHQEEDYGLKIWGPSSS